MSYTASTLPEADSRAVKDVDGAKWINTTLGMMRIDSLERRSFVHENENEITKVAEYWLDGECIHRSVYVHLKKNVVAEGIAAFIGS